MRGAFSIMFAAVTLITGVSLGQSDQNLDRPQGLVEKYRGEFAPGVPTAEAVKAAFARAEQAKTIETWSDAARIANTYANVVGVLADHYRDKWRIVPRSRQEEVAEASDALAEVVHGHLRMRNRAYLEMAKLYLAEGRSAEALSLALTAVELSGDTLNEEAVRLVKQIIDFNK